VAPFLLFSKIGEAKSTLWNSAFIFSHFVLPLPSLGPEVVKTVTNETVTKEDLGGSKTHTSVSGVAHNAFSNDVAALRAVRRLLDFLPCNSHRDDPRNARHKNTSDPADRPTPAVARLVPDDPNTPYDMKDVIRQIVDHGDMFEIMPAYAGNIVTAFARSKFLLFRRLL